MAHRACESTVRGHARPRAIVEGLENRALLSAVQAEDVLVSGAVVSRSHGGYTGSGYVDYLHASGNYVEFEVQAPQQRGLYELDFRYANGSAARRVDLKVDQLPAQQISFNPTGAWTNWRTMTTATWLEAGTNHVRINATGESGPDLDALTDVRPLPAPAAGRQVFQAEALRVVEGTSFGRSNAGFSGWSYVNFPTRPRDELAFSANVAAGGVYRVDFRYANGSNSLRRLQMYVNGEYQYVNFPPTGSASTWRTVGLQTSLTTGFNPISVSSWDVPGPSLDSITVTPTGGTSKTIEAESATARKVSTEFHGYNGTGYVHISDRVIDRLAWMVSPVTPAGEVELEFRYANGDKFSRPMQMWKGFANPEDTQYVRFAPTGSWSTWKTERIRTRLDYPGTGTPIELRPIGYGGPNIDSLTIRPLPLPAPHEDPDDTLAEAPFVPVGKTFPVRNDYTQGLESASDVDLLKFEARAEQRVVFRFGGGPDVRLRFFDAGGRELRAVDAAGFRQWYEDEIFEYRFAATGTYYLGVSAAGNSSYDPITGSGAKPGRSGGSYAVALYNHGQTPPAPAGPDPDDQFSEARLMSRVDPQTISDAISTPTDVDLFRFVQPPRAGAFLTLHNRDAAATDLLVRVFDLNGKELARLSGDDLVLPDDVLTADRGTRFYGDEDIFPLLADYYVGVSAVGNGSYNPLTGGGDAAGAEARYRLDWALEKPEGPGPGAG